MQLSILVYSRVVGVVLALAAVGFAVAAYIAAQNNVVKTTVDTHYETYDNISAGKYQAAVSSYVEQYKYSTGIQNPFFRYLPAHVYINTTNNTALSSSSSSSIVGDDTNSSSSDVITFKTFFGWRRNVLPPSAVPGSNSTMGYPEQIMELDDNGGLASYTISDDWSVIQYTNISVAFTQTAGKRDAPFYFKIATTKPDPTPATVKCTAANSNDCTRAFVEKSCVSQKGGRFYKGSGCVNGNTADCGLCYRPPRLLKNMCISLDTAEYEYNPYYVPNPNEPLRRGIGPCLYPFSYYNMELGITTYEDAAVDVDASSGATLSYSSSSSSAYAKMSLTNASFTFIIRFVTDPSIVLQRLSSGTGVVPWNVPTDHVVTEWTTRHQYDAYIAVMSVLATLCALGSAFALCLFPQMRARFGWCGAPKGAYYEAVPESASQHSDSHNSLMRSSGGGSHVQHV